MSMKCCDQCGRKPDNLLQIKSAICIATDCPCHSTDTSEEPIYQVGGSIINIENVPSLENDFDTPTSNSEKVDLNDICERCGLLRSTIEACKAYCIDDEPHIFRRRVDHSCCFEEATPPCGQKIEHMRCCLCENLNPKVGALLSQQKAEIVEKVIISLNHNTDDETKNRVLIALQALLKDTK